MKTNRVRTVMLAKNGNQNVSSEYLLSSENYKNKSKSKNLPDYRNDKEFKNIEQRENETDLAYLRRVNRITHESAQEAQFEAKYGVEVVRNKKTGEIKLKKKPANEIDERLKQNMENYKRAKKSGKATDAAPAIVLSSEEKRKLVKKMMAEKKATKTVVEPVKDFKKDEFKFGEVVHAPPLLTTPRLAKKAETVPRVFIAFHLRMFELYFNFVLNLIYSSLVRSHSYCILFWSKMLA